MYIVIYFCDFFFFLFACVVLSLIVSHRLKANPVLWDQPQIMKLYLVQVQHVGHEGTLVCVPGEYFFLGSRDAFECELWRRTESRRNVKRSRGRKVWGWCVIHAALLTQTEQPKVLEEAGCIVFICFLTE